MNFLSSSFIAFFGIFFLLYWFVFSNNLTIQNLLLLAGNYFFYAWGGNGLFLLLLIGSSVISFFLGSVLARAKTPAQRNRLLLLGLALTLSPLLYFKYIHPFLPLGLSFYTFRTMGYLLDIWKEKIPATRKGLSFLAYISFFPCIVAGPIDRPAGFLPQLESPRDFDYNRASDGMRRILWGLFKKVVIADNAATFSFDIFNNYSHLPASALWYGAFIATIWIYADFSGYSDIAIGIAALLGFRVTKNFNYPFFAVNIADFWRRWHISLTGWITEYVFTPLSILFRNLGKAGLMIAIFVNLILIGLWHGPRLTFIAFGILNGIYFIPLVLRGANPGKGRANPKKGRAASRIATFGLVMLAMIFFRSESLPQALGYIRGLFSLTVLSHFPIGEKLNTLAMLLSIAVMFIVEWLQRNHDHALQIDSIRRFPVRALIYFTLIVLILTFGPTKNADFIYLRF